MATTAHAVRDAFEALQVELPTNEADQLHYWAIQKKTKKGEWDTVTTFMSTKREAARVWTGSWQGRLNYRLRHIYAY